MKAKIFGLLVLIGALSSCNFSNHKVDDLVLDNGKKWEANQETTDGIQNMQLIIANGNTSSEELKKQLDKEFKLIFKNCTMKGEAHLQLHNYLLPLKKIIGEIDAKNASERDSALNDLKKHLSKYKDFFK